MVLKEQWRAIKSMYPTPGLIRGRRGSKIIHHLTDLEENLSLGESQVFIRLTEQIKQ